MSRPGPTPWTRRALLGTAAIGLPIISAGCAQSAGGGGVARQAPGNRRVCIGYALWHRDNHWDTDPNKAWGTPEIGYYRSDDPSVLARHANWLSGAEVDFVIIDWSNDLSMDIRRPGGPGVQRFIEESTVKLFNSWTKMSSAPRVALMIGNPGDPGAVNDGRLTAKANEVYELFVANKARAPLLETYLGKPLLLVYAMTPSPWGHSLPPWHDDRFTVRFITGFLNSTAEFTRAGRPQPLWLLVFRRPRHTNPRRLRWPPGMCNGRRRLDRFELIRTPEWPDLSHGLGIRTKTRTKVRIGWNLQRMVGHCAGDSQIKPGHRTLPRVRRTLS